MSVNLLTLNLRWVNLNDRVSVTHKQSENDSTGPNNDGHVNRYLRTERSNQSKVNEANFVSQVRQGC